MSCLSLSTNNNNLKVMTGAEAFYLVIIYKSEHNFPAGLKNGISHRGAHIVYNGHSYLNSRKEELIVPVCSQFTTG